MSYYIGPRIVTDGLALYLDAANSKSYPGSGNTWYDLSRNGYNGTLTGGPTYNSGNNGYISVDGSDDYILIGPVANIGISNISVSWCVWVYPTSTAGNIMSMSSTNPQGSWNMPPIAATGQTFRGKIWSNNYLYSSTYSLNTWYYLTLVFDYANSSQLFYVNGILQSSQGSITYSSSGASNYIFLGQSNPGADNTGMFTGRYGSFKIYTSKALSQSEILQNFNATKTRYGL
jgi:hypothetical protein